MYARETVTHGTYDPAAVVEQMKNTVLPGVSGLSGFRGLNVGGDPASETIWVYTLWDGVDDLVASRQDAHRVRRQAVQALGGDVVGVREWDFPVIHKGEQPVTPGLPINVNHHFYDPALLHEVVSYFAWVAEPVYRSAAGYRAVRMMVDRTIGEVYVASVWDDVASLEAGFELTQSLRDRAVAMGMEAADRTRREVIFTDR